MYNKFLNVQTKKILIITLIVFVFTIIVGFMYTDDVYDNVESYRNKLIRFHVIANSDNEFDQTLKLKVRDEILADIGIKLEDSSSIDESRLIILDNLDNIKNIAKDTVLKNGYDYNVEVGLGNHDFPTKNYGDITLPAGEYEAVRVVIGDGKGKNWWCVMFPPLCYVDITHGLSTSETEGQLTKVLDTKEYNMISSKKDSQSKNIRYKFKIVELIEKTKLKFAKLFISRE